MNKSKMVIACNEDHGCVLWYTGDESEVNEYSIPLIELYLDDAPVGISVWEGSYVDEGTYRIPKRRTSTRNGTQSSQR